MRSHNLDVILALIIVVLNSEWSLLSIHLPLLGTLLALPMLFFIPGYLLTDIFFQKRLPGIVQRIVLSLTISLCIVLLSGFLLNLLPGGLNARSWSIYLGGLNTLLGLLAMLRRRKVTTPRTQARSIRLKFSGSIVLGLALLVMIASLSYSAMSITNQPRPGFTQFWLLPSKQANNTWQLKLGVHNDELAPVTYNILMSVNHTPFKNWPSVTLNPEQEWNQSVSLSAVDNNSTYVQAQLYYSNKTGIIHRELHSTLYSQNEPRSIRTPMWSVSLSLQ
jgi:uncharacterized membrane protein